MSPARSMRDYARLNNPIDRISLSELLVDFFGSLVPGLIFTVALAFLFSFPLLSLLTGLARFLNGPAYPDAASLLKVLGEILNPYWVEVFLFTLMIAFVAGHFFFRQDPKVPDRNSFNRIKPDLGSEVEKRAWVIQDADQCEFPYPNLYGYLKHRGLTHLAQLVPWRLDSPTDEETVKRTKTFINILKIRLAFHYPEKCGAVARNEAHVRLMSSTWYMSRALQRLSRVALVLALVPLIGALVPRANETYEIRVMVYVLPVFVSLIVLIAASQARDTIERFLHYQRVREIVYVLETAYTAFRKEPEIIQDLCPDFMKLAPVVELRPAAEPVRSQGAVG